MVTKKIKIWVYNNENKIEIVFSYSIKNNFLSKARKPLNSKLNKEKERK